MSPFSLQSDDAPRIDLLHGWEFLADPSGLLRLHDVAQSTSWRKARAGLSWNAQFEDLRDYLGVAWYRRTLQVAASEDTPHLILRFGAVDYFAEVFINGLSVGTHEGGYTPFSFDIGAFVKAGKNELMVRVIDPPMDEALNQAVCPEMMYNEIPHGKQNWYLQNAGMWQGVRLELCPSIYIEQVHVTPNVSGDFAVDVQLLGSGVAKSEVCSGTTLHFSLSDNTGKVLWQDEVPTIIAGVQSMRGNIPNPRLWSPESPSLYWLEVTLEGAVQYRKKIRFGFRKFEARDGKLLLNDKPFYMVGALDQDFYPETIHTPSSEELVRELMVKAKRMGINVLRCHLKVCHPVYLTVADEVGMLVWAEMPSWSDCWYPADHFSIKAADRGRKMFEEMLARDWNHPSIVIQTIMNESWGIDLKDANQRTWLKNTFNWVKESVGPIGRLVVDNSACEKNFHLKSDIEDFHNYYSMPDQADLWEKWVSELASRPTWTYSSFGDAERSGREPIIVSEFGNWGLPKLSNPLPWWFNCDFGGREVTRPAGVLERFHEYKLDTIFSDYNDFATETQWHQFASLKHEIESIRKQDTIQGYVITAITDIHWEVNGLLDMWRNEKVFADQLRSLQQSDLVMLDLGTYNYWSESELSALLLLSHYGVRDLRGARVRWWVESGQAGQLMIDRELESGRLHTLAPVKITFPAGERPRSERINLELRAKDGTVLSENSYEVFIYSRLSSAAGTKVRVHGRSESLNHLSELLVSSGYCISTAGDPEALLIASAWDQHVAAHVESGGKVLLILDSEQALPADFPIHIKTRTGSELDGRWFSNFNWVRNNSLAFADLTFSRVLGFESRNAAPTHVIRGIEPQDFASVIAGASYGWIASNVALAVSAQIGAGRALFTTFRFNSYGDDPYVTHLLDSLVRQVEDPSAQVLNLQSSMSAQSTPLDISEVASARP